MDSPKIIKDSWCGVEIDNSITIKHIDAQIITIPNVIYNHPCNFKKIFSQLNKDFAPFDEPFDKTGTIHFRIRENYEYVIENPNEKSISLFRSENKGVKWKPIGKNFVFSISGFLGIARLQIDNTIICLEVVPTKIDFDSDFILMTNELSEIFSQLLLDWNTPTYLSFKDSDDKKFKTLYEQFVTIKHLLESEKINSYLQIIQRNPHQKLVDESKWEPSFAADISSFIKNPLKNGRDWNTKTRIPSEIYSTKRKISIDTPPNQFVKYFLQYSLSICNDILEIVVKKGSSEIIKTEVIPICQKLEAISTLPFFKEISLLHKIPFDNQTLQKRTGYREILRAWIGIQLSKIIDWEDRKNTIDADVRNVAKLYEFWLFFKLHDIIQDVTGVEKGKNTVFKSSDDGQLSISLKEGKDSIFDFNYNNENGNFKVSLYYNRSFSRKGDEIANRGSYSRIFRPDYTIVFYQGDNESNAIKSGTIAYLHFDAKYRIDSEFEKIFKEEEKLNPSDEENVILQSELDEEETEAKVNKTYKRGDLYKMHTYNDAILKTVGSYVLYPGDISKSEKKEKYFTAYHEILPGVGAFAIKPIEKRINEDEFKNEHLKKFIEDCFKIQSNKFSQLYQLQHDTHEIVSKDSPFSVNKVKEQDNINYFYPKGETKPPAEINIITGYVRDLKHIPLMERERKFWWHAIKSKKIENILTDVFKAEYILLKREGKLTGHYGKINSIKLVPKQDPSLPDSVNRINADYYYLISVKQFILEDKLKNIKIDENKLPQPMKWSKLFNKS